MYSVPTVKKEDKKISSNWMNLIEKYRVLLIFIVLCLIAGTLSDVFFTMNNVMNVLRQVSIVAIIASGMTLVILIAGIDLSVGAVMAFSGAILAGILTAGLPLPVAVLAALGIGLLFGVFNGFVVANFGVPSFIATLATMVIARGMTLVYTNGYPLVISHETYRFIGNGNFLGIPIPIIIMFFIFGFMYWMLKCTSFGRYIYAIGGNEETAILAGINVKRIKIAVFGIAGLLSALSAIIYTSRLMSAQPNAGTGIELDAIAAVIIGGTSLAGGRGGVAGTLIGALIMSVLDNVLNLMNVSPFYQSIAKGLVILIAVLVDSKFSKIKK
ncbi:ribose ABC transporter permease [Geobacillus sp. NFOSA3]|uniref:Ribose ABC transporter permease n=1 Tax=Parageobacillus galactosidasius TaxID=883812 RepID=A0A226QR14_9BACL|nr:ribose ABC transporter permease [Geobacillus sp. NFOSA3]OXB94933.1 ribose ABC transporter permease [Parageobacillus galactosidasius]